MPGSCCSRLWVVHWGFETHDLKEAKALLEELAEGYFYRMSLSRAGVRFLAKIDIQLSDRSVPGPPRSRNWF